MILAHAKAGGEGEGEEMIFRGFVSVGLGIMN